MKHRLATLLQGLSDGVRTTIQGDADVSVAGLTQDSRAVGPGFLFVAVQGTRNDGHRFVADAVARGASAVLVSREVPVPPGVSRVLVPDTRAILPALTSRFFGAPSERLTLVGITGTNGKTTISYLLEHVLTHAGRQTGVVGTVNYRFSGHDRPARNTTPDLITFQALLAEMADAGVDTVVAEISSHALVQGRVNGLQFDAALFTNLSRDHLDYHGTLEAYFLAKQRLFVEILEASHKPDTLALINRDDPFGERLAEAARARRVWGFSTRPRASQAVQVLKAAMDTRGIRARLATPAGELALDAPLLGPHSLQNLTATVGIAIGLGVPPDVIADALHTAPVVPGRLEPIPNRLGFTVLVDYAHTPDALDTVLSGLQPLTQRALITVFGCGGDRDHGKRPLMGKAAASRSSLAILTSDNPRHEDPEAIIAAALPGVVEVAEPWTPGTPLDPAAHRYTVVTDRRDAIGLALETAREGDIVVIAGKGHETTQAIGDARIPFDDRAVARDVLARLEGRS